MKSSATALAEFRRSYDLMLQAAERLRTALLIEAGAVVDTEPALVVIQETVAAHFGLAVELLRGTQRPNHIAHPRMIAMALSKEFTECTLYAIGLAFRRDHGAVIHAIEAVGNWTAQSRPFAQEVETIRAKVRAALAAHVALSSQPSTLG